MTFWGLSAEDLFVRILRGHYQKESGQSDADLRRRIDSIIDRMPPPPLGQAPAARERVAGLLRARMTDSRWLFDESYNHSFS